MSIDLLNRDPNCINNHLQCGFEDVIAEPDAVHSIDCVWRCTNICFEFWKSCCYKISTLLCGICIATYWGCEFASLTFNHVWYFTPCLKQLEMNCTYVKKCWGICIGCCLEPLCVSCGQLFHAFKRDK